MHHSEQRDGERGSRQKEEFIDVGLSEQLKRSMFPCLNSLLRTSYRHSYHLAEIGDPFDEDMIKNVA